jgi:hypothetical protein
MASKIVQQFMREQHTKDVVINHIGTEIRELKELSHGQDNT